jgi:hypothetical protein
MVADLQLDLWPRGLWLGMCGTKIGYLNAAFSKTRHRLTVRVVAPSFVHKLDSDEGKADGATMMWNKKSNESRAD